MPDQTSKKRTKQTENRFTKMQGFLNPLCGVLISRFYLRTVLQKVFAGIPIEILPITTSTEDSFVHYEVLELFKMASILRNSAAHKESEGLVQLWSKNLR
jgi:hypothetical protein